MAGNFFLSLFQKEKNIFFVTIVNTKHNRLTKAYVIDQKVTELNHQPKMFCRIGKKKTIILVR